MKNSSVERRYDGDAWDRFGWQLPVATAVLTVSATAVALTDWGDDRPAWLVLVWATAFAGWQAAWRPWERRWATKLVLPAIWGLGTIALWAILTLVDPVYFVLLFVLFSSLFSATDLGLAEALTMVLAIAIALVSFDTSDTSTLAGVAIGALFSAAVAIGFGRWIHGIIEQSRERKELIVQLEATRVELAAAERSAGALAERARLSAEIHDTLTQGFASIVLLLEAVRPSLGTGAAPESAVRRIDLAIDTARTNLTEARHLVADLGPAALTDTSLPDAVKRIAAELENASGARVEVAIDGMPRRLQANQEVTILRVAQESLTNIRKHADATSVRIDLLYCADDSVELRVRDDGRGFDTAADYDGFGLDGMSERLRQLSGELNVNSVLGRGTKIRAILR